MIIEQMNRAMRVWVGCFQCSLDGVSGNVSVTPAKVSGPVRVGESGNAIIPKALSQSSCKSSMTKRSEKERT